MNIDIHNISKRYLKSESKALDNIDIYISKGIFGLIGENGAGKTTLLKTLATLIPIQEGTIKFNGEDLTKNIEKFRSKIGYLPQSFDFFEGLTIYEMLDYVATLKGVKAEKRNYEVTLLIKQFGLEHKTHSIMKKLSGGMKQRVAIAQTLLGDSELIILDEPTVGLDPNERLRFRNIINEKSEECTILISTHIISDIAMMCNNVGIMKEGKMLYCGDIEKLLKSVEGKIFVDSLNINDEIDKTKYKKIISIMRKKNKIEVRFIKGETNNFNYTEVTATLEDAYFYVMFVEDGFDL